ncbi:MAG: CHAT domain-containing tetratricopeptide repeat protein [Burkholderiales bacterium]
MALSTLFARPSPAKRRWAAPSLLALALSLAASAPALAQTPVPAASLTQKAQERLADSDTLLTLTREGALLYSRDAVKMSGYEYCSQALALAEAGEFRRSVRAASKALYLAETTNNPDLLALAKRDLAIVYSYAGQLDRAEDFARQALTHEANDPKVVVGPAYKVIGDVQARRGQYVRAIESYEQALAGGSERYAPLINASLANALIEAGETARARSLLASLPQPEDAALAAQLARSRARLLLAENQPREARDLYRLLADRSVGSDTAYHRLWAWDGVARSERAMGNTAAAAQAAMRAVVLVDSVRARFRSEEFRMGLFSDLQRVFENAVELQTELGDAPQAMQVSERSRSRALLDAVRGRADLSANATETVNIGAIQQTLKDDERLVQFHSLPDRLLVWVVGAGGVQTHSIPITRSDLTRRIEAWRNAVINLQPSAVTDADALGATLIAPLNLAAGQRLVIVPHGPLHYLPFQALRVNGSYLIEQHPVSVAPSASIAVRLARAGNRVDAELAAFGNPRIGDKYELPGAEAEVKRLARLFPGSQIYLGAAATKTQFAQAVAKSTLVHVAAHAEADQVDPLYSRILLANEDGRQNFLEAREILGLQLSGTALVTLSACESGLGRIGDGDEVLGFTRSFLAAGTKVLIASLWPVADEATSILMTALYGELAKGRDVQQAMQAGQLAVLRAPGLAHPLFWAPFNLIGDWRLKVGSPA